jgi:DnaB-like helicase C terminal domain
MDPKLLLVKIATLLYKESQLKDPSVHSASLVKELIAMIKIPETTMDFDRSREMLHSLRMTVGWMSDHGPGDEMDRSNVLQRIRINTADDESLYYAFEAGIEEEGDLDKLKSQCLRLRMELRDHINQASIQDILKQYSQQVNFRPESVDWRNIISEMNLKLEKYRNTVSDEFKIAGILQVVNLADADGVRSLIQRAGEETSTEGILKTGYQAINRMLGDHGGIRRGEFVLVGALPFNYKTGFTLNLFKHLALYNTPYMRDPSKKPLLLHISAENELHLNIVQLHCSLYENETGMEADKGRFNDPNVEARDVAIQEAQAYIYEKMSVNGYHIEMARCDPSTMTYQSVCDMITHYETQGYEIHAIVFDYLNMISKAGCSLTGPMGSEIRDLFRRIRNFTAPRGITVITPHQLSQEAKKMVRMGITDFVKHLPGKGLYDSCGTVDQEADLEIFIHIEQVNGEYFLTVQRGKHRKPKVTPSKHHYTVLPFREIGGILDDLFKPDSSRKVAGGGVIGSGEEVPWFAPIQSESGLPH